MAFISSGFRLLPYAGILPLPFSIALERSSSLIFATSGSAKLRTFIALPVAVSPLPSTPWHASHFFLYIAVLFSSAFADVQNMTATAKAQIPTMTFRIGSFCMKCFLLRRIRETNGDHTLSLKRVSYRKRDKIAPEISRRKDVLHCAGSRVFMVAVVIPECPSGKAFRELVI